MNFHPMLKTGATDKCAIKRPQVQRRQITEVASGLQKDCNLSPNFIQELSLISSAHETEAWCHQVVTQGKKLL